MKGGTTNNLRRIVRFHRQARVFILRDIAHVQEIFSIEFAVKMFPHSSLKF